MQQITVEKLAQIAQCKVIGKKELIIEKVVYDSRKTFLPERTLFVAIKSGNNDGHRYIKELYDKSIRAFIVESCAHIDYSLYPEAAFIECAHSIECLQLISQQIRQDFKYPVVGITGSNGKTIVKEWLSKILEESYNVGRSPRSFNSQIGVPLSLLLLTDDLDYALIEAGISQPNEMEQLANCVQPNYGVLTAIGSAHQENFSSLEQKLDEKLKLFHSTQVIFCHDEPKVMEQIKRQYPSKQLLCCGASQQANLKLIGQKPLEEGMRLSLKWKAEEYTVDLPFADAISINNALLSILVALKFGVDFAKIGKAIRSLQAIAMRLEQKEGVNNCLLIDDAYNSDLTSLELALDFLNQMGAKRGLSKTLILSDIFQSGMPQEDLIAEIKKLVKEKGVHRLIGIGPELHQVMGGENAYCSTDDFIKAFDANTFKDEAILLKGSRSFSFERISALLEQRRHKTVLEINLNALTENVQQFRSKLCNTTKLLAMVKAFSYGSGSFEIANVLQHQKVDYLGVAFADEGIELREAGITLPIIVMNPELSSFPLMLSYDLEPEIYSFEVLNAFEKVVQSHGLSAVPVHLKLDTGMNRLGFLPHETEGLLHALNHSSALKVASVFSHLAGSDELEHDEFTRQQIQCFTRVCAQVQDGLGYSFFRHILNSAGIERFPEAQFDMVRLGIGMYGVSACDDTALQAVITLKSYVSQLKHIAKGDTIGYGRIGTANKDMQIGIVPIGYADGFNRLLSNGVGQVVINGQLAPVVGNICMDMCMVDVTHISLVEGDEVEVFGSQYTIHQMAQALHTIPYEILTSISRRVKRVYVME